MSVMVHDLAWRHEPDAYPRRGREWHEAALGRARRAGRPPPGPVGRHRRRPGRGGRARRTGWRWSRRAATTWRRPTTRGRRRCWPGWASGAGGGYLLTVSTLEPRKNLPRLLAAYALARPGCPSRGRWSWSGPAGWGPALPPRPSVLLAGRGRRRRAVRPLRRGPAGGVRPPPGGLRPAGGRGHGLRDAGGGHARCRAPAGPLRGAPGRRRRHRRGPGGGGRRRGRSGPAWWRPGAAGPPGSPGTRPPPATSSCGGSWPPDDRRRGDARGAPAGSRE